MPEIKKTCLLLAAGAIIMIIILPPGLAERKSDPQKEASVGLLTIQNNSLFPVASPPKMRVAKKIRVVATAYSSTPFETDDDPYTTAAGTRVRDGVVANNLLPFGTKIRIPEIYGDKIFVVEDRMHRKKGYYQVDIWFPTFQEAKAFGVKRTYIEVLES
jgi:3D (Asp-Asp-Asp) domain-containing protein